MGRKPTEPKVVSTKDTVSSLPGGRNCSAAMIGESPVREVESRIGRATASVPQTGRLCMREKSMRRSSEVAVRGFGRRTTARDSMAKSSPIRQTSNAIAKF